MAEERNQTPEKQLLNLIEGQKSSGPLLHTATIKYQGGQAPLSFNLFKGKFGFAKNQLAFLMKLRDFRQWDIHALNEVLRVAVILLSLYLSLSIVFSVVRLKKGIDLKAKTDSSSALAIPKVSTLLKADAYYLEKARSRDIFAIGLKKAQGAQRGPSQKIIEATQSLRLVGISWSSDPDVMIEDTKNQRTFFLKKGQMIDNEIKLEAVFKDKVILRLGEEEIELR